MILVPGPRGHPRGDITAALTRAVDSSQRGAQRRARLIRWHRVQN